MPAYHRRLRHHSAAVLGMGCALLLAVCGPISVAAAQTEASDELQAEATDRGLLLTLDDAVFVTNDVGLSSSGHRRLAALTGFLEQHPERTVAVDGHAGVDGFRYDQALSKRRADAVKAYLVQRGIASRRLTGRGNSVALQDYDAPGRQQPKRRVEVLIVDPLTSVPRPDATAPGT